jgi:hypothetical protein
MAKGREKMWTSPNGKCAINNTQPFLIVRSKNVLIDILYPSFVLFMLSCNGNNTNEGDASVEDSICDHDLTNIVQIEPDVFCQPDSCIYEAYLFDESEGRLDRVQLTFHRTVGHAVGEYEFSNGLTCDECSDLTTVDCNVLCGIIKWDCPLPDARCRTTLQITEGTVVVEESLAGAEFKARLVDGIAYDIDGIESACISFEMIADIRGI